MATYLPSGSNVKGDTMQTLYLMNPSYTGYTTDSTNPGNMVLVSTGASAHVGNSTQHQQYDGFSLPPHMPQQSQMALMPNRHSMDHQNAPSSETFSSGAISQGYSWNGGGNELMFIPSSNMREDNNALTARLAAIQPNSSMSHIGIRNHLSQASFQEEQQHGPFIPTGVSLVENNMQVPTGHGHGQILSLSLSPQPSLLNQLQTFPIQQHLELGINNDHDFGDMGTENYPGKERFSNHWTDGGSNSLRVISPNVLVPGYQGHHISASNNRQFGMFPSTSPKADIYGSKFLKPVQELLNEVVSIVRDVKANSPNLSNKSQPWASQSSYGNTSFQENQNPVEMSRKDGSIPMTTWANGKDIVPSVSNIPNNAAGMPQQNAQNAENVVELTASERQEIQSKKAKLMTVLDEVDQRYRQYHHQMQIVVTSFESTAGVGAARTYTELALQTISKHFRCLKDAIRGQIRVACKALGEEDSLGQQGRGDTSRLRFIDQQLRQQRALQHLGMMQQHPWRPQRGLPERSVSVLRAWLFEHFLHPYPKDSDKVLLARQTGLTRNQVSNWFINARVRLWKPMVEEMYAEEMRDMEGCIEETDRSGQGERENNGGGGDGGSNMIEDVPNNNKSSLRTTFLTEPKSEALQDTNDIAAEHASEIVLRTDASKQAPESFIFHEKQSMGDGQGGPKKARNGAGVVQDSFSPFVSPNVISGSLDYKAEELHVIPEEENERLESYTSMFQLSGLNRYPNEAIPTSYAATSATTSTTSTVNNNNSVSLTLGLQHSEGLSLSGSHQPYMQGHGQLNTVGRHVNSSSYYGMHNGPWQLRGFDSSG